VSVITEGAERNERESEVCARDDVCVCVCVFVRRAHGTHACPHLVRVCEHRAQNARLPRRSHSCEVLDRGCEHETHGPLRRKLEERWLDGAPSDIEQVSGIHGDGDGERVSPCMYASLAVLTTERVSRLCHDCHTNASPSCRGLNGQLPTFSWPRRVRQEQDTARHRRHSP
jgi:hypothetical protein